MNQSQIRNFAVIAHIDHGKTTLTDRLIEIVTPNNRKSQTRLLDSHPIEQERGITIKLAPITLSYTHQSSPYYLNLIDTPGHIDFNYEVERSLAACEGALLLVDATQGVQAQTLGNLHLARQQNLTIIPVINKIDLPQAQPEAVIKSLKQLVPESIQPILLSAKTGQGVSQLPATIINSIPSPSGNTNAPLRALVFNSVFHPHLGVVAFIKVVDGSLSSSRLFLTQTNQSFTPQEIGIFTPNMTATSTLETGQVGYVATGLKNIHSVKVGDTLTNDGHVPTPLPGYRTIKPNLFLDIYPTDSSQYKALVTAVEKIKLHDSALTTSPTDSPSMGHGLQVGFLGLLHADIFRERLDRDFNLSATLASPSVQYRVLTTSGESLDITRASDFPDPTTIKQSLEPMAQVTIITPPDYLGNLINLLEELRGVMVNTEYLDTNTVKLSYRLPLIEVITKLHDSVKSISSGYASVDYRLDGYQATDLVRLDVFLNHVIIEPLSRIEVKSKSSNTARRLATQLKDTVPRHQFEIPIQVQVGGTIIARETVKAFRKDVTAKLYGGDRTRRLKLLEKQKKGKAKMKSFGQVNLPPEVFRINL